MVLAGISLRLWDMKLHVPMFAGGDANYGQMLIKTVMQQGWLGVNPHLGAPFGGALHDHTAAFGDASQLGLAKLLGYVSSDPAAVLNALYLLGFPIVACVSYLVLRSLRFGPLVSLTCAVIYTLMPYHFLRNESHLTLGMYWSVPVAAWLVFGVRGHVSLFERRAQGGRLTSWLSRRTLLTVFACVVVGTSGVYYAVFLLAILALAAFGILLVERDLRRLVPVAAIAAVVVVAVLCVQAPQLAYHASHGDNPAVAQRFAIESEIYGLKPAGLVLPAPDHHIDLLARVGAKYWPQSSIPGEGQNTWLGTSMSLGLLLVLLAAIATMLGRATPTPRSRLVRDAGALALAAIAIGSIGGLSTIFAFLISPQVRGWDRISVFVGFFALIGVAAALTWLGAVLRARSHGAVLAAALAAVLLGFAAYDQMTPTAAPNYEAGVAVWGSDARFVRAVDAQLPQDAKVLQLPYVPFPENPPVVLMVDYDQLKGYLHSDNLRWSYGATKGRKPDDWMATRSSEPIDRLLSGAVAAGFRGVWVDTYGYTDGGAAVTSQIARLTGAGPSVVSEDKRHQFYNLASVSARVDRTAAGSRAEAGDELLHPVLVNWAGGFYPAVESDATSTWHWARSSGVLHLGNPSDRSRAVVLRARLATPGTARQTVTVVFADGTRRTVSVRGSNGVAFRAPITLKPGDNPVTFSTDAPDETSDPRDLRLRVIDTAVTDVSLDRVIAAARR